MIRCLRLAAQMLRRRNSVPPRRCPGWLKRPQALRQTADGRGSAIISARFDALAHPRWPMVDWSHLHQTVSASVRTEAGSRWLARPPLTGCRLHHPCLPFGGVALAPERRNDQAGLPGNWRDCGPAGSRRWRQSRTGRRHPVSGSIRTLPTGPRPPVPMNDVPGAKVTG